MDKFIRSLITEWRKLGLPFDDETVVVAVSGGADSMSLMLALHELRSRKKILNRTIVAHLNHRLRGSESDEDESFVREQAERCGFEFVSKSTRLPKTGNLEQHARDARYRFLQDVAIKNRAFAVLTAHTQNDQAETFLLNLSRGPRERSGRARRNEIGSRDGTWHSSGQAPAVLGYASGHGGVLPIE